MKTQYTPWDWNNVNVIDPTLPVISCPSSEMQLVWSQTEKQFFCVFPQKYFQLKKLKRKNTQERGIRFCHVFINR